MPNSVFNFTICLVHRSVTLWDKLELSVDYQIKIYMGTSCSKELLYGVRMAVSLADCSIENFM